MIFDPITIVCEAMQISLIGMGVPTVLKLHLIEESIEIIPVYF